MIKGYLWQGVSALLALVLLVGGIMLGWALVDAKGKLQDCEQTNRDLVGENTELRTSLGVQTAAVQQWQQSSEQAAQIINELLSQGEEERRRNANVLQGLLSAKATTCTDAMPHLREALKGIR